MNVLTWSARIRIPAFVTLTRCSRLCYPLKFSHVQNVLRSKIYLATMKSSSTWNLNVQTGKWAVLIEAAMSHLSSMIFKFILNNALEPWWHVLPVCPASPKIVHSNTIARSWWVRDSPRRTKKIRTWECSLANSPRNLMMYSRNTTLSS